jgi:hypothetical protein
MKTNITNILKKITDWCNVNKNLHAYVYSDYFNGSHNDAENVFLELKKLTSGDHFHHGDYFVRRLNYLINEGIDVTSVQSAAIKRLAEQEYNSSTPKKTTKKKVVKQKAVKKTYKPKRDRNGRFIAR